MSYFGTRVNWEEVDIIWTLEISYLGEVFRFSTITMDLVDGDGKSYPYLSGLEDVVVNSTLQKVGDISAQADSVSMAITFQNLNIAIKQIEGKFLEGSKASIGYALIKNGEIQTQYDDRPIIFKGIITSPNYGHPNRPVGYVEFSIENKALISSQGLLSTIMGPNMYVESVSCSNALYVSPEWPQDKGLTEVQDIHRGKVIPWVFGKLHGVQQSNGDVLEIPITPAYVIAYDPSAGHKPVYYLACGHVTNANTIQAYSNTGEVDGATIYTFVNIDNRTLTYFHLDNGSPIPQSVAANDDRQVWIEWDDGGAYPNPVGEGDLEGGGDICLWLLSELTTDVDYESWNALRPLLNQYKFAGYVNDDKITVFQWLQKNIVAYLPISIVNGPNGLKPVLDLFQTVGDVRPRLTITAGTEFQRAGAVVSINTPEDVSNHITVRYAMNGVVDDYSTFVQVSNEIPAASTLASISYIAHPKSMISIQRYGRKEKVVSLDFCYDNGTAQRIAQDILEREALPMKSVQYSVSLRYGYLVLGDIIQITDDEIGLDGHHGQIISKVFDEGRWLMDIKIDYNPLRYNRNV
jgi:hypothetical protein